MTNANFREGHPTVIWNPNLIGHQQKNVSKGVHASLDERTKAITEEIEKMKLEAKNNNQDLLSNP